MIGSDFDLMLIVPAFLAGALVLSTHVPLGQEVLKRGIIFIDLAIAQIAALGVIAATLIGHGELDSWQVQLFAGLSALAGATLVHYLEQHYAQILEALIGLLFILAASGGLILASYIPHSNELLHDLLVGQILWVSYEQLLWVAALYLPLLLLWFTLKSKRPMLFYIVFSLAVTASVQLVGIYLVFASLILPAIASRKISSPFKALTIAYLVGVSGYIVGLIASLIFDLPTGAIMVWGLLIMALFTRPLFKS